MNKAIGHEKAYSGIFSCIGNMFKTEGIASLYNGLGPAMIKIVPGRACEIFILLNCLYLIESSF